MKSLNSKNKYENYSLNSKLRFLGILVILFGILFFGYLHKLSPTTISADVGNGNPVWLTIPQSGAMAKIEEVVKDGKFINPPKDPINTGWYSAGPKPGEVGSAVINGYVHWEHGYTARFADLNFLEPGDTIEVTDDRGVITIFIVSDVKTYGLEDDIEEAFNSTDGIPHLNLVTHDGSWDSINKTFSRRVVVFTDKDSTITIPQRLTEKENAKQAIIDRQLFETLNIVDGNALIVSTY